MRLFLSIAFECATCFNYVMKDFNVKVQASANKNYANRSTLMTIILFSVDVFVMFGWIA